GTITESNVGIVSERNLNASEAPAMKADVLKKHHYWFVALTSVVLVLLAFFMLSGGVSEAIEGKQNSIKDEAGKASKANALGSIALKTIEEQKAKLETKRDDLWKENWETQSEFFTWRRTQD